MSQHPGDTSSPPPELPAGYVARDEAARISGLGITAWRRWETQGKVTFGQWFMLPGGGKRRIFSIDAIQQMMRNIDLSFPPAGTVGCHEAARMFGVAKRTFSTWEKEGRITCGRLVSIPGKPGQYKVYPIDELHRLVEAFKQVPPFPPPGFVTRSGAAAMFGISIQTWTVWEGQGKVDGGQWFPNPGKAGRCKLYRIEDLQRLKAQFDRQAQEASKRLEPYADPDRPGVVRVPVLTEKHQGMEALIDAADLSLVQGKRWNWAPGSRIGCGSVLLSIGGSPKPSLARFLLGIDDPEQLVSHRNGDRLDCRRENLVVRTRSQVRRASKKMRVKAGRVCSSRFKGVTRTQSGRKWTAMIAIDGQSRYLGVFRSEIDAALAYDAALRERHGQDTAGINLPDPAEAQRLRALETVVEDDPTWPPPGMVDRHGACAMFGVSLTTWTVWERRGRITCGQLHRRPNDQPGRCKLYPKDELERARVEIEKLGKPYPDPDRPGVWRVPLKGYLMYREALIDEADLPIVQGRNWNWSESSEGAVAGTVILATTGNWAALHRLIAGVTDPKLRVVFANGDPLDCRRENLLVRSLAEVMHGSRKVSTRAGQACTSRFKGVSWHPDRNQWVVQIRKGGVGLHLGRFDSETDAAHAYDAAARVLFGENGRLNFPDEPSTEQAMAEARAAMDCVANRKRAQRRRQRDLERELRRFAAETHQEVQPTETDGGDVMLSRRVARRLFNVSRAVWRRWRRLGWLPAATKVDGRTMYALAKIDRLLRRCGLVVLPYPDPQRPGVYRVPLAGETARGREALIDADALPLVQTRRWRFAVAEGTQRGGEVQSMNPAENLRMHQVVMGITGDESLIGFRNDDPLDCRRANLVLRDQTQTHANHRKQATFCGRPCTSRFKGVCWDPRREHWMAKIKKNGVSRWLGYFRDEIAAAEAYDEAARELFGEHAQLNFPDGVDARLEAEAEFLRQKSGVNNIAPDVAPSNQARAA